MKHSLQQKKIYQHFTCMKSLFIIVILTGMLLVLSCNQTQASDVTYHERIQQYAPIFYFEAQEQFYPIDAQYFIDNSYLNYFDTQTNTISIIDEHPTASSLQNITDPYYFLDNIHASLYDSQTHSQLYQQQKNQYDTTIYYQYFEQGSIIVLQYWCFYAYNLGDINVHEGDWEMVQIVLQSNTPTMMMFSQHNTGQKMNWDDVEKTNTHPHVYVARGSHASYPRYYQGKLGMASDTVGKNGRVLSSAEYSLVDLSDQPWITFAGRWGEMQNINDIFLGFSGSFGPMFRENSRMYTTPFSWGESLPEVNTGLLPLEWFLYHFLTFFILTTMLSLAILSYKIIKRYKTSGLGPRFLSFLYIDAINKYSLGNILFFIGIIIAGVALFLPWYTISADITASTVHTDGFIDLIQIDGINGVQITYPGAQGPIGLASFVLPFSVLIGIGILFTLLKSIGLKHSKDVAKQCIKQSVSLLIPIIILFASIVSMGMILPSLMPDIGETQEISTIFSLLSKNPIHGAETVEFIQQDMTASLDMTWGFGLGSYLLICAGIIVCCSAILLYSAKKTFY